VDFSLSPEQEAWLSRIQAFAEDRVAPRAGAIDRDAAFPHDLIAESASLGLTAVTIDPRWGGGGRDYLTYALAIETIAAASATLAVILTVTNSLVADMLQVFGTGAQQQFWLPRLAAGEVVGAFALSEEHAGSDATNQKTRGVREGDGYRLTGRKVWVANAQAAGVAIVFAAADPEQPVHSLSAFLVPIESEGVHCHARDSLGVRGLGCADLELDSVAVPADARLGAEGAGWAIARRALEGGRIAIAAQALGVGHAALEEALEYARHREAFGQPIGQFQAIQFQIADLVTEIEAARLLMWWVADAHDREPPAVRQASMAKLQASEAAHRAADRAMQILASAGYERGSTIERLFRDARAAEIYQGTSEVQRMIIADQLLGDAGE
jgi:alkylation response protein AidB-like acyl-CoA dehydrogenase